MSFCSDLPPPLQVSILAWKLIPRKWKETCWKAIPKLKSKKQLHCFTQNETIIFKNQTITIKEQRFFAIFWAKRYIFDPSISWPMDSFCASGMSLVMILPVWSVTSRHPVLSVDTLKLGSVSASSASSQPSLFFCHLLLPVNVFGDRRGVVTGAACPEAAGKSSSSSLSSSASQSGSSWQADNPRDKHDIHMNAWYTDVFVLTITQKKGSDAQTAKKKKQKWIIMPRFGIPRTHASLTGHWLRTLW